MSQEPPPPTPPPLPPPLPAWPVPPASFPPMASLAYTVARPRRPGVITAIGVLSVAVGALGFIAGVYTSISLMRFSTVVTYGRMMMSASGAMTTSTGGTPTTAPSPTPAAIAVPVSPRGLDAATRTAVGEGLAELRFLSAPRLEQLDALLAAAGRDMFPVSNGQPLTADDAGALVEKHTSGLSADPSVPGPDIFRTKAGRFEVYDDRAVFFPNRAPIVRVSTLTTSNPGLTDAQVENVVRQAQSIGGNTLNPSQVVALRTLLSTPGQQFVSPITIPTAIRSAASREDGTVVLTFPNGYASLGPQGQTTSAFGPGAAGAAAAALAGARGGGVNGTAMALAMFAVLAGFALAVYLFVIGIMVLNNSPRGRRLHLVYAWLKIPVALLAFAGTWWLATSYLDSGPTTFAAPLATHLSTQAAIFGVLGLVYPIALLIVLQARTVKDFYGK